MWCVHRSAASFFPARPLYATADGGVIFTTTAENCAPGDISLITGAAGLSCQSQDGALPGSPNFDHLGTIYTLDQNGNQAVDANGNPIPPAPDTGAQLAWTGEWYVDPPTSISELWYPDILTADKSFSPTAHSNPSKNDAALQRCAPLDSADNSNLESSFSALTGFLLNQACVFCNSSIFQPLHTSQAEFTSFLRQGHEFCDGNKSQEPGALINAGQYATVADAFKVITKAPGLAKAATEIGGGPKTFPVKVLGLTLYTFTSPQRKNLKVFFAPQNFKSTDTSYLESVEFHEALHGFSGLDDSGLCSALGATTSTKIGNLNQDCPSDTDEITDWIEDNIIAPFP